MNISNESTELKVSFDTEKVYPTLEDLVVTPMMEEQHFKSEKYGYDEVKVNAIKGDSLIVEPTTEDQIFEGLYNRVMVNGEPNLVPENIPEGINIFGVEGNKHILDTSDATATAYDIISPATAYVNGEKIEGAIIPIYSESATGIINKINYLTTSEYMTIGFSRDNKYAIKLDYSTQELIVYSVGESTLTELKKQSLSTFVSGAVSYQGSNSISFSDYGACENKDCAYVYVGLDESKSFITVFNIKTLEFNYSTNGYANFYNINTATETGQGEPIIGKLYFTKYINLCVSYVHDSNNYKRFYSFLLNKNGTATKTLVHALGVKNSFHGFDTRPTANGDVLQLTLNNTGWNYDNPSTSFTRYLIYLTNGTSMTLVNTTISYIFSPSGTKATDGTKIYESSFNLSSRTYSVTELFSLPKTYTIINFITENMFLAWTTNKQIILVTLDYDNKTSTENIITLTYPLTQSSTFFNSIINVVSKDYLKISVEIEKLLISLNIKGRDYYLK